MNVRDREQRIVQERMQRILAREAARHRRQSLRRIRLVAFVTMLVLAGVAAAAMSGSDAPRARHAIDASLAGDRSAPSTPAVSDTAAPSPAARTAASRRATAHRAATPHNATAPRRASRTGKATTARHTTRRVPAPTAVAAAAATPEPRAAAPRSRRARNAASLPFTGSDVPVGLLLTGALLVALGMLVQAAGQPRSRHVHAVARRRG